VLVVVLAMAYTELGWWAPLLAGGFVILAWDNHPMPAPDPRTGVLNPEGFGRRLDGGLGRMRRGMTPGATLLSMDLDLFQAVNDRYGQPAGDEVLREIGGRLAAQARRPHALAGRLGGDEFALFLPGLTQVDVAMRRADDVVAAVSSPVATSVGPVSVGASVGVLVLDSWGGVPSAGTVLRHADQAMFHAKRDGGRIHLYDGREPAPFDDTWLESRRWAPGAGAGGAPPLAPRACLSRGGRTVRRPDVPPAPWHVYPLARGKSTLHRTGLPRAG